MFFTSEWKRTEIGLIDKKGVKGALGLAKASWGGIGGGKESEKVRVEKITEEDMKKIWLVVAKGQKSIYLIPSVRSSVTNTGSWARGQCWPDEKKIWEGGVERISEWNESEREVWTKEESEKLKNTLKSGITIKRGGDLFIGGRNHKPSNVGDLAGWRSWKGMGWGEASWSFGTDGVGEKIVYKNTGILGGKDGNGICEQKRNGGRGYFPLDIEILGTNKWNETRGRIKKNQEQEIEISDKIAQVIGVRLDQVVISETGIGDGSESEINWEHVSRPSWTRELLK
ncbi:hypothetical protein WEN_03145 [Mycoplasma wenyonii str. Massachusetts]|uniref:Uncharacterized protein n=1 Tax=Mycoplasma wenyonii (strain Massachusetts) TaxID=1197325 RepID=I6ZJM9_MYCWM|nr:hypothetical protein [Mycoplasma wenyonii]AFN65410.1 hypothetical protein WEN_03145 [Mycoplasma wenyonii str. Massachusetts]